MLSICHRAVFSTDLLKEWRRHESGFARLWRVQMVSRRKEVRPPEEEGVDLGDAIAAGAPNERVADLLRKDLHLVSAALKTDRVIITLDDRAQEAYGHLSETLPTLKRVKWLDPSRAYGEVLGWLRGGK
jgi:hypothetical protein